MGTYRMLDLTPKGRDEQVGATWHGCVTTTATSRSAGKRLRRLAHAVRRAREGAAMTDAIPHVVHQDTGAGAAMPLPAWPPGSALPPPDLCPHGAVVCSLQQPAGHALHGDTGLIADERNDDNVSADERLQFIALAETDL